MRQHMSYVQHTSAFVSIRQHTSAYAHQLLRKERDGPLLGDLLGGDGTHAVAHILGLLLHTSAYVSIRATQREMP